MMLQKKNDTEQTFTQQWPHMDKILFLLSHMLILSKCNTLVKIIYSNAIYWRKHEINQKD